MAHMVRYGKIDPDINVIEKHLQNQGTNEMI